MKYEEWLKEWSANYVAPRVKARTCERYAGIIEKHLKPRLGNYETAELTSLTLQRYVTGLTADGNLVTGGGLAPNTINLIITVLKESLKAAYAAGAAERNAGENLVRPKIKEKPVACFTTTEQRKIECGVLQSPKRKLIGILICLYTGLRLGELLALTWRDVNLTLGVISVNKTCYDFRGSSARRVADEPKTPSSRRLVPIPRQLIPLLKTHKKAAVSSYVIESPDGKPVPIRSYQRSFEILQREQKIERRNFHALRHTFATRAIECGVDVKTLSEVLGHKNAAVTLNRYTHSLTEHKTEMMNRIGKIFRPQNTPISTFGGTEQLYYTKKRWRCQ